MPSAIALMRSSIRAASWQRYVCPSCQLRQGLRTVASVRPASSLTGTNTLLGNGSQALRTSQTAQAWHMIRSCRTTRTYAHEALASSTAINAPTAVLPELRQLHQRLVLLQEKASSFVNLSQIQLAIRSLESQDPVVRVAFLGLGKDGQQAARQLVRVLFSDPLEDEQEWEKELGGSGDGRSVLLRYGDYTDASGVQTSEPLVRTLNVPSSLLKKLNVEIMVTGMNAKGPSLGSARDMEETILVPPLTIPNSNGRIGFVRHPVHQALIIAKGISGAVDFGKLPTGLVNGKLISAALSLPLRSASGAVSTEAQSTSNAVDVDLASHALGLFRESKANGAIFSREWQTSRVPMVTSWLKHASESTGTVDGLKPALRLLLDSIVTNAETAITTAETNAIAYSVSQTVTEQKRNALVEALASWSERSHRDLQVNLDASLESKPWRKTAWWRLFWRIDEISISASDVLVRGWLVEAEQTLAFISGRVLEAGLASEQQLKGTLVDGDVEATLLSPALSDKIEEFKDRNKPVQAGTVVELLQLPPMLARIQQESGLNALFDPPWPQTIGIARQQMLHQLVPALHRKGQVLLLSILSTFGVSAGLAGTLFAASGGVALYEAGAIAAFGFVWGLRRLQKKWGKERTEFERTARENGRAVLADVEKRLRTLINDGGRVAVSESSRKEWQDARGALRACQESLASLSKKSSKP